MKGSIPRPEHPRPDFVRQQWMNLNGEWQFAFDDNDVGLSQQWQSPDRQLPGKITVPFCYQCELSEINDPANHPVLWYLMKSGEPCSFIINGDIRKGRIWFDFERHQ